MPSATMTIQEELDHLPEELRLHHCVQILKSSPSSPVNDRIEEEQIQALNYLRLRAIKHSETEAKTKLSFLYSSDDDAKTNNTTDTTATAAANTIDIVTTASKRLIKADSTEADVWSRSVFDKQLSHALQLCVHSLTTNNDLSLIHYLLQQTATAKSNNSKVITAEPGLYYLIGLLYIKGIGFQQDVEKGIAYLKLAAATEYEDNSNVIAAAGCELGRLYGDRYAYSLKRPSESMYWFHKAFECGSTQAVVDLAYGFFEGTFKSNMTTSSRSSASTEHANNAIEQVKGNNDDVHTLRYAREGATLLNDRYCQYIVGHFCLKGRGGMKADLQEALSWLQASAQQGFIVAKEEEASLHMARQNYKELYECCTQKHASQSPFCQAKLGDLYRNGWYVEQDFHKAFECYQNAASQSEVPYPYAQHMLGEMFLKGEGVPKDLAVAKEWFQIASAHGYEPSQSMYKQLTEKNMTTQRVSTEDQTVTPQQQKRSSRWSLNFFTNSSNGNKKRQ